MSLRLILNTVRSPAAGAFSYTIVLALLPAAMLAACKSDSAIDAPTSDASTERDTATEPPNGSVPITELRIQDADGASWHLNGLEDTAAAGLTSVRAHNAFWFAFSVFHPGAEVFEGEPVRAAEITGDSECTVPCDRIVPGCPGRDCIPPLDNPTMVPAGDDTLDYLADEDIVLGVVTSEGPRAYPHNILWWHEIANEEVGGEAFSISLCPLTGSGLRFDRTGFVEGETVRLGVSGLLYNSNLVMWDEETETLWSQMRLEAVSGMHMGTGSPLQPVFEMTWAAWRALYPETLVISSETGFSRNYTRYPYTRNGDYRTNHQDTFRDTEPAPDEQFNNKDMVSIVFVEDTVRGYVWPYLEEARGSRGVINDEIGGLPVAVVYDLPSSYVHVFEREVNGETLELSLAEQ